MCQICNLDATSKRYPWPVPVREHVTTLQDAIPAAREACHAYRRQKDAATKSDAVNELNNLYGHLKQVSTARETWWQSKKDLREQLRKEIENERQTQNFKAATQGEKAKQAQRSALEKYNELQAINTRAVNMFTDM